MSTITVHSTELVRAIELVRHAAATEPARPVLNTVMLRGTAQGLKAVAADNYRLAEADIAAIDSDFGPALIWLRDIPLVLSIARSSNKGTVELAQDGTRLTISTGALSLSLNLCDGNFPRYETESLLSFGKDNRTLLVGINPAYVAQALAALKKLTSAIGLYSGPTAETPLLIDANGYRELIMPVRLAAAGGHCVGSDDDAA